MRKHVRTYNVAKKFHHTLYIRKVSKKASEHTIRYFLCIQYIILNGLYRTVLLVRTEYFDHTVLIMQLYTMQNLLSLVHWILVMHVVDSCICMHTNVSVCRKNTNTSINIIHGLRMQVHTVEDQNHLHKGECWWNCQYILITATIVFYSDRFIGVMRILHIYT